MKHILKKISHHKYRKQFHLKKDLTLFNATSAGVGGIIGAGIYVLIGAAAGLAGHPESQRGRGLDRAVGPDRKGDGACGDRNPCADA